MEVILGNFGETKYTYFWLHLGITINHPQLSVMPFTHLENYNILSAANLSCYNAYERVFGVPDTAASVDIQAKKL
jgi:hypothetical protein